ncbi:hypothetical protein MRB53_039965 [Persea americana]|nr:hypothetical protein MRB53_039965 [Persea americana]
MFTHRFSSDEGDVSPECDSLIEMRRVRHVYPSRPGSVALDDVTGRILLDGKDLATYQLRWLRQQIAIVKQESFMFDRSVFDNIALGLTGAEWQDIPDETRQRLQRLAIARALVGNPRILILDEATSALDVETEAKLLTAMAEFGRRRTTIVIAHRLSTISHADKIVVLSQGRVVESGTHDELVAAESHYCRMVQAHDLGHGDESVHGDQSSSEEILWTEKHDETTLEKLEKGPSVVSVAEVSQDNPEAPDVTPSSVWSTFMFLLRSNKDMMFWPAIGLICCIIAGGEEPASAVIFAKDHHEPRAADE